MPSNRKTVKKTKKTIRKRIYDCAWYEHYYDDFVNVGLCWHPKNDTRRCKIKWKFCSYLCPMYKKGETFSNMTITDFDRKVLEEFKREHGIETERRN